MNPNPINKFSFFYYFKSSEKFTVKQKNKSFLE